MCMTSLVPVSENFLNGLYGRVVQVWPMAAAFDPGATPRLLCPRLIAPASPPLSLIIRFDYFLMANAIAKMIVAYISR